MKLPHDIAPEDIKHPVGKWVSVPVTVPVIAIAVATSVAAAAPRVAVTAKMLHDCCIWK